MPAPQHLIMAPILIPFITGALMLLYDERQRRAKLTLGIASTVALLAVSIELLNLAKGNRLPGDSDIGIYLLGDWQAPFGIVLVLDRMSAMMLVLVALLALPAMVYSAAAWHRQGQRFHALFQFLLMGLNGAFLTGDLFNLFVFFEVLLAASYGLLLHGGGQLRVRAGLHYIAINLTASLLFLIGVSLIYGVTGTLNMGHLAVLIPALPTADLPLLHAGAAVLGLAFLVKAGIWPLSFWLPTTYMAGAAPVAAMFAIMTKVGVYVIIRLGLMLFGASAGASAGLGGEVLVAGGMATIVFGLLGVLASQGLGRMAAHLVLISSGTLLAVTGFALAGGSTEMLAGGLYYMVSSTLAVAALFLLLEPMSREDGGIAAMLALTADAWGHEESEDEDPEAGLAIPATMTVLGLCFGACLLALAGLPPLSGFIGKFAILSAAIGPSGDIPAVTWGFMALLLLSGFATLVGLVRVGIQSFWGVDVTVPKVLVLEIAPVIALVAMGIVMSVKAQDTMTYLSETAEALLNPLPYIEAVATAPRVATGSGAP
jgi:multicomponent K+:H+ antiporter subunit D